MIGSKLKEGFFKVGQFLRLIDENRVLSITNIALWVIIAKIAAVQEASMTDIAALLTVVFNYAYKRYVKAKEPKEEDTALVKYDKKLEDFQSQLKDVKDKIGEVAFAAGFRKGFKNDRQR